MPPPLSPAFPFNQEIRTQLVLRLPHYTPTSATKERDELLEEKRPAVGFVRIIMALSLHNMAMLINTAMLTQSAESQNGSFVSR